jgi:chemotaxis protein MotD
MTGLATGSAALAGVVTPANVRGSSDKGRMAGVEDGAFGRQIAALDEKSRNSSNGRDGEPGTESEPAEGTTGAVIARPASMQAARLGAASPAFVTSVDFSVSDGRPATTDSRMPEDAVNTRADLLKRDRAAVLTDLLSSSGMTMDTKASPPEGGPDGAEALVDAAIGQETPDSITAQIVAQIGQTATALAQPGAPVRAAAGEWPNAMRQSAVLMAGDGPARAEGNPLQQQRQDTAPDRLFQFARTDERSMAPVGLDRSVARAEPAPASDQRKPQDMIQRIAPDISIVESRKFLGVAAGQTATAAVIASVTENSEWNAMLRETAATSASILNAARNGSNTLKIQLHPLELGIVTASFRLTGEHLTIELKVETIEAYRQLSNDNSSIVRALKGHGYDVEQITIQHIGADRSAAGNTQDGGSTSQQGGASEGRQSGTRSQADSGAGQRQAGQNRDQDQTGERTGAADRGAAGRVAGDVYL